MLNKVHYVSLGPFLFQNSFSLFWVLPLLVCEVIMVFPGPVRRQVGVVGGGGVGDGLGAPRVQVAEVVGQLLRLVRPHVAVIPQYVVVTRTTGALQVNMS